MLRKLTLVWLVVDVFVLLWLFFGLALRRRTRRARPRL